MSVDQSTFIAALLDPAQTVPDGLIDPDGRPAGKRFDVYRNNVVTSLIEAMETAFPVIRKLVGDAFFKSMTGIYVRAHPPATPLLMFYGTQFPKFLETFEHTQNLPYLPDIARLELARIETYHAADTTPIDVNTLTELSQKDLMKTRFNLSPAMKLLSSRYPIYSIWNINMMPDAPEPKACDECVIVYRPELDVSMQKIDIATHMFFTELRTNTLGDAYTSAVNIMENFDFTQALNLLLSGNIITDINT